MHQMVQTLIALNQTIEAWVDHATAEQRPALVAFCEQFQRVCRATDENMRAQIALLIGFNEPLPDDAPDVDLETSVLLDLSFLP